MFVENILLGLTEPAGLLRNRKCWYIPTRAGVEIDLPPEWDRVLTQREDHDLIVFDYDRPVHLNRGPARRWSILPAQRELHGQGSRITIVQFDPTWFLYDPTIDKKLVGVDLVFSDAQVERFSSLEILDPPVTLLFRHYFGASQAEISFFDIRTLQTVTLVIGTERAFLS